MNDTPSLGQLIEPSPIPFTFEAPGWKISAILILLSVFVLILSWWMHYRKNRYRREALLFLQQEEERLGNLKQYAGLVYSADMLMKRIGMQRYGREKVAALRGREWTDFLNKTASFSSFGQEDEKVLAAIYTDTGSLDERQVKNFTDKTKRWIKKHKYVL